MNVKVLNVLRTKNDSIYAYTIQDSTGRFRTVDAKELKESIKNNLVSVTGYKLTKDNRLIKSGGSDIYQLMNRDELILEFTLDGRVLKVYSDILPYDFMELTSWLSLRFKISCAKNVREFFSSIGLNTMESIIDVTHCISLHDTFWVKHKSSNLTWCKVSPYTHDYSKLVSEYALEGTMLGLNDKSYFSPTIGTDGSFPHTWEFSKYGISFIKAGSKYTLGGSNSGREPFSEYYASVVAEFLNLNHVSYKLREHRRQDTRIDIVTECPCYTTEYKGSVTARSLGLRSYEQVIKYCKNLNDTSYQTILDMLFLDCLLLNTDRHFGNIEFFIDNKTLDVLNIVPIFDNNYSFLPRFMEGYEEFNRSDYIARDGRPFENLYRLIGGTKAYKSKLIRLKSLKLVKPKSVDISDRRLSFLNWFLQMQVDYLLSLS